MSISPEMPRQRAGRVEAAKLRDEAISALQHLHDTLLEESPQSFDGLVTFAIDQWHERNASAVATVQPVSDDDERFAFYKNSIENNRIDLSATAFGDAMTLNDPRYLQSRMNPKQETYTERVIIDHRIEGGVQSAWNTAYGPVPSEEKLAAIWRDHTPIIYDVLHSFSNFVSSKRVRSIGDLLELQAPATPNAFIISWDMADSTKLALSKKYGALRNYLLDAKTEFNHQTARQRSDYHDNGDGQDIVIWLPDGVDRADLQSVGQFGTSTVLPLLLDIQAAQAELAANDYSDIDPHLRFAVGLGYVEKNQFEIRTSQELWKIDDIMNVAPRLDTSFTDSVRTALGSIQIDKPRN